MSICQYKGCEVAIVTHMQIPVTNKKLAGRTVQMCLLCRAEVFEDRNLHNRELARERTRQWKQDNPEKAKEHRRKAARNQYAKKKGQKDLEKTDRFYNELITNWRKHFTREETSKLYDEWEKENEKTTP